MTDSQGTTVYHYDSANCLLQVDGPGNNDSISYEYDAAGNRKKMTDQDGGITTYEYDPLNRLKTITDPLGNVTTYEYDPVSNLKSVTYPNKTRATYDFDRLNRLIKLVNEKTDTLEVLSSYKYDYNTPACGRP